jgi:S-adenosyl-L-methionine hydrolase (adenosine-forming)
VIVALLTDFGTRDHYVGAMKAVILSVCPDATLVDITHDIPPQDILTGALELAAACRYFPAATVFAAVVDPGVGTRRRGIATDAGGYRFVGPDNGLLSIAGRQFADAVTVELRERKYARPTISRTFEGRDRFAPAAGWLARGITLHDLGPVIDDAVSLDVPAPGRTTDGIEGAVLRVDRFGNLITNVDEATLAAAAPPRERLEIRVASQEQPIPFVDTYGDVSAHQLCALVGSSGYLEIALNGGSAAATLNATRGTAVHIVRSPIADPRSPIPDP